LTEEKYIETFYPTSQTCGQSSYRKAETKTVLMKKGTLPHNTIVIGFSLVQFSNRTSNV
jgi:hypothetical protein